jgi:hypothetical protein
MKGRFHPPRTTGGLEAPFSYLYCEGASAPSSSVLIPAQCAGAPAARALALAVAVRPFQRAPDFLCPDFLCVASRAFGAIILTKSNLALRGAQH